MKRPGITTSLIRSLGAVLLTTLLSPAVAHADKVWIGSSAANALELPGVTVTGIAGGKLLFQSAGRDTSRDLASVARIQLDNDATTSAAETAFAAGKYELATDAYLTALQATAKTWLKPRLAQRLMESAEQANRFDAAATGYIAAVLASDAPGSVAKPALPAGHSTYLATAAKQVTAALADATITAQQRQALSGFLIDLQRASGDEKGAAATAQQIIQAGATHADAAAGEAVARLKLDAASAALARRDYAGATDAINANRSLFTEPRDQAQALFDLAQAKSGLAGGKRDAAAWQDAALAYMRVAAHFPQDALAPKALLATAQIEQQELNDPKAVALLCQQIIAGYPSDPSVAGAKQMLGAAVKP